MMLEYWLWLAAKEELPAFMKNQLIECFGTPEHLYAMSRSELMSTTQLNKQQIAALSNKSLEQAQAILYDCEKLNITIMTLEDSGYPAILRCIPDPPLVLYAKGKLPNLDLSPGIGIVGTRKATNYGLTTARQFGGGLAAAGFTVISGMALGVDAAAARGALGAGGKTIAVFAGGLNICYPPENNFLMSDILRSGAVISENPPGTKHDGYRFPIRNRIISGLSRGVLVVEAPARSGALITAHLALDQGREVFAVPNAIYMAASMGCNHLIRDGEAGLVTSPQDIIQALEHVLRQPPDMEKVKKAAKASTAQASEPQDPAALWDKILSPEQETHESADNIIEEQPPTQEQQVPKEPAQAALEPPAHITEPPSVPAQQPDLQKKEILPAPQVGKPQTSQKPQSSVPPESIPLAERTLDEQRRVAQAVMNGAGTPEDILEMTDLPAARAMTAITILELDGVLGRKNGRIILLKNPK